MRTEREARHGPPCDPVPFFLHYPAFNASMPDARKALADFIRDEQPEFVPADTRALDGDPAPSSGKTTHWYLANLAAAHGMGWATLDMGAKHPSAVLVS